MNIQQLIGDGSTLEFSFSFQIPKGGLVNVYKTLNGNQPNEINDLLSTTDYNLVYTDINADFTDGKVTFNTAPADGDYITITPLPNGNTDIDFTAQNQLSADNLNLAFARHTTPINYSFGLYTDRSVRYAINVKQNEVNSYNTLLPALKDQEFWRRSGSNMIAQPYDDFVSEVSHSITNFRNELEQVTIHNQTGATFSLSGFSSGNVSQTTLDVFKNGLKLSITGDYSINSTNNTITFTHSLVTSDVVYVIKPLVKKSNTYMDQEGDNAIFTHNTLVAAKNLSNVSFARETGSGKIALATQTEVNTGTDDHKAVTSLKLETRIKALLTASATPVGTILYYYGTTPPNNYLALDGTAWSKTTYAELFAAIGSQDNVTTTSTTFALPDFRNQFIRSLPDTGRQIGDKQTDAIRNITGIFHNSRSDIGVFGGSNATGAFAYATHVGNTYGGNSSFSSSYNSVGFNASRVVPTADENRPINITILACIKYTLGF